MSREDILLKEYETCQSHNNSSGSQYWITVGIFMGANTALLGWVASSIISNKTLFVNDNIKWLVLILGIAAIVIIVLLMFWLNRVNTIIFISNYRMREIEVELGMRKNYIVHSLDRWNDLSDEQREDLTDLRNDIRRRYFSPLRAATYVSLMYKIVICLWGILIVIVF